VLKRDEIKRTVVGLCEELDVFDGEKVEDHFDSDFYETGVIDSVSLSYLRSALEESFGIEMQVELFLSELRTLEMVIDYIKGLELDLVA